MRAGLVALVACSLLAGCSSGPAGTDFKALAMAAPDLLKADMQPDGELQKMEGSMTMDMTMTMDGQQMPMEMTMDLEQEVFDGGAFLMTMEMRMSGQGMSMTMHFLCTPDQIRIWTEGMPGGEEMDQRIDNPTGKCSGDPEMMDTLRGDLDSDTEEMLRQMMEQGSFDLTFDRVEGGNTAVYTMKMDGAQAGMSMDMTLEATATLDGERISHLDLAGAMDIDMSEQGMQGTMHADITGSFDFSYGDRAPLPSQYA